MSAFAWSNAASFSFTAIERPSFPCPFVLDGAALRMPGSATIRPRSRRHTDPEQPEEAARRFAHRLEHTAEAPGGPCAVVAEPTRSLVVDRRRIAGAERSRRRLT